jgi:hypothetical protein
MRKLVQQRRVDTKANDDHAAPRFFPNKTQNLEYPEPTLPSFLTRGKTIYEVACECK